MKINSISRHFRFTPVATLVLALGAITCVVRGAEPAPGHNPAKEEPVKELVPKDVMDKLKFPGLAINLKEQSVDVDATVCLDSGMLELIACTKDSKEHEAIIAINAKAIHIHTALLLLRAKPGNPAMQKQVGGKDGQWVSIPPSGGEVGVYLVFKDAAGKMVEHPISAFITRSSEESAGGGDAEAAKEIQFPTHNFIFAGSQLVGEGDGPKQYLSDQSGDVISIVTFGDELLCLSEFHAQDNESLVWEVNSKYLPAVGSKVILRLRPVLKPVEEGDTPAPVSKP